MHFRIDEYAWMNVCAWLQALMYAWTKNETNKVKKRMLFNKTRQYNIQIFDKIIFFKYRTRQIKTTETNKVTYLN